MGQRSSTRNSVNKALRKGANPQRGDSWRKPKTPRPAPKPVRPASIPRNEPYYADTGCDVAPSCLACPLPACKHDDMAGYRQWIALLRAGKAPAPVRKRQRYAPNGRTARPVLPTSTCRECGGAVAIPHRQFCGPVCRSRARLARLYPNGRPFIICETCGKRKWSSPSKVAASAHHYCSHTCAGLARRLAPILRRCAECGGKVEATHAQVSKGWGWFCSIQCAGLAKRKYRDRDDLDRAAYRRLAHAQRSLKRMRRPEVKERNRLAQKRYRARPEVAERQRLQSAAYRASFSPEWKKVLAARARRRRAQKRQEA